MRAAATLVAAVATARACLLPRPLVVLKSGRSASTSMARELAAITRCPEKQEIVHVHKEGRQNASCARQEAKWRKALAAPQVITHNPVTTAGGCFGTHAADGAGARRLARMLQSSNATVVSWTRRNSLRVVLADMCASNTGDNSGSASACYPWRTADYSPEYVAWRTAIEYGKRQKIVSIAADAGGVADFDFETFAAHAAATLMALLGHVLGPKAAAAAVAAKPPTQMSDSSAPVEAAFDRPELVLSALKRACLDWTFFGGSWENAREPRAPCPASLSSARSATSAAAAAARPL